MQLKHNATPRGAAPEILLALMVADGVYRDAGESLTVTEITGATHSPGSLHYVGLAADLRLPRNRPATEVVQTLRDRLGPEYDVVMEKTHIHVEFQPKRPTP